MYDGQGASSFPDLAVGSATAVVDSTPTVFAAGKTWIAASGSSPAHWAVVINRYHFIDAVPVGSPFIYPATVGSADFFVPVAIKILQTHEGGDDASNTFVVVTGYKPAGQHGATDMRTVCFTGDLGQVLWDKPFSKKLPANSNHPPHYPDEYPVGMDAQIGGVYDGVVGITGNTWNGTDWDIATAFYEINGGSTIKTDFQGTVGANDLSAGISMRGANQIGFVVGTLNDGVSGNTLRAFRYDMFIPQPDTRSLSITGATLKANAMTGIATADLFSNQAVAAGKATGVDGVYMLLSRFDFHSGGVADYSMFAGPLVGQTSYSMAEGKCIGLAANSDQNASHTEFYAVGGLAYRDANHGTDALVCLFDNSTSSPHLRWSSWLNQNETGNITDICTRVAVDSEPSATADNQFYVYAVGQVPDGTDLNWRVAAYKTAEPSSPGVPSNPLDTIPWSNLLAFTGSVSGFDIPLSIELNPIPWNPYHNFIVTGNVYNGTTHGDDILTRRFLFTPP